MKLQRPDWLTTQARWLGLVTEAIGVTLQVQLVVAACNAVLTWPVLLVLGLPHKLLLLFVIFIGSLVRFDRDQYTWKSDSSELLRRGQLRLGSNLFHIGVLFLFFGHFFGMLTPHFMYEHFISAGNKQLMAMVSGGAFGVLGFIGVSLLLHRRLSDERIRATMDDRHTTDPVTGVQTDTLRTQDETVKRLMPTFKGSVEWKPDTHDTWALSVSGSLRDGRGRHFDEHDVSSIAGVPVSDQTRTSDGTESAFDHGQTLSGRSQMLGNQHVALAR